MDRVERTVAEPLRSKMRGGTVSVGKEVRRIGEDPMTVGNDPSCDLQINDPKVSQLHCQFTAVDIGVELRDLGSTNKTWVGDIIALHAILREPTKIRLGDTILDFAPLEEEEREIARSFGPVTSRSPAMWPVLDRANKFRHLDVPVHITGESGTGKEYMAKMLHRESDRASKPFVVIDCAAIPAGLAASLLFGHEKGSFTGADRRTDGFFSAADGGTVFIDEIGDLPPDVQAQLLRIIDYKEYQRVGQVGYEKVDVWVITATHYDLTARVNREQFRGDLFHRIMSARLRLPPLRERLDDLRLLTQQIFADLGHPEAYEATPSDAFAWMRMSAWKGNIRRLRHVLRIALKLWLANGRNGPVDIAGAYDLGEDDALASGRSTDKVLALLMARGPTVNDVEAEARRLLLQKLAEEEDWNVSKIADRCEATRRAVSRWLKEFGMQRPSHRAAREDDDE